MRLLDLLTAVAPPVCVACAAWAGAAEPLCAACRRGMRWLGQDALLVGPGLEAWAPLAYAGPARDVVAALKFRGVVRVAGAMAAPICAGAPPGWLDGCEGLVPVPLHPARRRRRGFNQAERLAAAIGRRAGPVVHDCLSRAGPRATQMGRGRAQRLAGIEGSIHMREGARRPPERVVLVDDVMTTGATLAACAQTLRAAGAMDVRAVAYARTPGR